MLSCHKFMRFFLPTSSITSMNSWAQFSWRSPFLGRANMPAWQIWPDQSPVFFTINKYYCQNNIVLVQRPIFSWGNRMEWNLLPIFCTLVARCGLMGTSWVKKKISVSFFPILLSITRPTVAVAKRSLAEENYATQGKALNWVAKNSWKQE